jgi:hypothetical protein
MRTRPVCSLVITLTTMLALACGGGAADKKDVKKVEDKPETKVEAKDDAAKAPRARARAAEELRMPAPKGRVVAIGGLGGDLATTTAALKAAGAIDDAGNWSGGDLVVVQLGNVLGGGKDEKAVLALLDKLAEAAKGAGGALYRLSGEQEILNVTLNFDGVNAKGFKDWAGDKPAGEDPRIEGQPKDRRGRAAAFASGGSEAKKLAEQKFTLIVGDTVFAHGGVLEEHVKEGLDTINKVGRKWMLGEEPMMPNPMAEMGPARTSKLRGNEPFCGGVEQILSDLAVKRLVKQRGPEKTEASMCDGKLIRIGAAAGDASGGPEVLEISGDATKFIGFAKK